MCTVSLPGFTPAPTPLVGSKLGPRRPPKSAQTNCEKWVALFCRFLPVFAGFCLFWLFLTQIVQNNVAGFGRFCAQCSGVLSSNLQGMQSKKTREQLETPGGSMGEQAAPSRPQCLEGLGRAYRETEVQTKAAKIVSCGLPPQAAVSRMSTCVVRTLGTGLVHSHTTLHWRILAPRRHPCYPQEVVPPRQLGLWSGHGGTGSRGLNDARARWGISKRFPPTQAYAGTARAKRSTQHEVTQLEV